MSSHTSNEIFPVFLIMIAIPGITITAGTLHVIGVPGWLIMIVVLAMFVATLLMYLKVLRT